MANGGFGVEGTSGEPRKKGFDYFFGFLNQGHAHRQFPEWLWRNETKVPFPENELDKKGSAATTLFTNEAISFLHQKRETPFFLYLAYTVPHAEMGVPDDSRFEAFQGKFEERPYEMEQTTRHRNGFGPYRSQSHPQAAYAAMVQALDHDIRRLVDALKTLGLDKNTLVIFTSDNGPHSEGGFDPAPMNSSGGLRGKKRDLYEGGIRVPAIAWQPGAIPAGMVSDAPIAAWDFFPTFCDLARAQPPKQQDGVSLLPLLYHAQSSLSDRALYWEFHERAATAQAIRKGKWKAVRLAPTAPPELYDLIADPGEKHNVAAQYPDVVEEMQALFANLRTDHPVWPLKAP